MIIPLSQVIQGVTDTIPLPISQGGTSSTNTTAALAALGAQPVGNYATGGGTATGSNTGDQTDITGNAATATALSAGADRTKLDGIATGATNYSHPANHPASIITQDASNRFVTDAEKTAWDAKQPAGTYATGTGTATGINTGDQTSIVGITGTLAQFNTAVTDADLQAALVSGTTIKTVNSTSLLGSGDVAVGDVTLTGTQTLTNKTLTGYTETVYALSGTDISVANGTIQTKTLSANTTFTESLADGQSVILGITAGAYTVTWPTTTWSKVGGSGTAPTLTSTGVNWVILWQVDGTLRGSFLGTA